jgi:ubiquitin C-terminal hydrolase
MMPKEINFAEVIDLKDFLEIPEQESCYELITVSTHIGASGIGGHYISFCKDNNRKWHKFNDSAHSECDYKDIFSFSPYLLLYKKVQK